MTVIYYDEGDHEMGFVGWRVATTLGYNGAYAQKYFSLSEYGAAGKAKAYALDKKWRKQAEDYKLDGRRQFDPKKPDRICTGFTLTLKKANRKKNGKRYITYSPCVVIYDNSGKPRAFGFSKKYDERMEDALKFYAEVWCLPNHIVEEIRNRLPSAKEAADIIIRKYLYTYPNAPFGEIYEKVTGI